MEPKPKPEPKWLTSTEVRKILKISTCDLMHLRESDKLRFQKKGNAFLYSQTDVQKAAGTR